MDDDTGEFGAAGGGIERVAEGGKIERRATIFGEHAPGGASRIEVHNAERGTLVS